MLDNDKNHLISNLGKKKWRKLLAVSGGIDSQLMLHQQLTETDDEIHVLHVKINRGNGDAYDRSTYEFEAFEKCMEWHEANNRPIAKTYIEEFTPPFVPVEPETACDIPNQWTQNHLGQTGIVLDHDVVAVIGGWIVRQIWADKFMVGRELTEDSTLKGRMSAQDALVQFCASTRSMPVEYVYPLRGMHKRDIWKACPPDLAALTVRCRVPTKDDKGEWVECNKCFACLRTDEAKHSKDKHVLTTQELMRRFQRGNLFVVKDGNF